MGLLLGFGLVIFGLWILQWGCGRLLQVRESLSWPATNGVVLVSEIEERSGGERKPHVEYSYQVNHRQYRSRQIGFDLPDHPGGKGRVESIISRYPVGSPVQVFYPPYNPQFAVLETGDFYPFLAPMFIGGFMFCFSAFGVSKLCFSYLRGRSANPTSVRLASPVTLAVIFTIVIYGIGAATSFNPAGQEVFERVFGRPFGLSPWAASLCFFTIGFIPMPYAFFHLARILLKMIEEGQGMGEFEIIVHIAHARDVGADLAFSRRVVIGGFAYCLALFILWIILVSRNGL